LFINHGQTKSRTVPGPSLYYREDEKVLPDPKWWAGTPIRSVIAGTQITESDGNRWPPPKGGRFEDFGSEFFSQKKEVVNSTFPFSVLEFRQVTSPNRFGRISGSLVANCFETTSNASYWSIPAANPPKFNFPPDLSSSRESLVEKGTNAIAACAPSNQIAQVASSLGELYQKVPQIPGASTWKSRLEAISTVARSSADEFLNVAFGVLPTIADMGEFLKATHNYDKAYDQFVRDAGRIVRREFRFPKEVSVTEEVLTNVISPAGHVKNKTSGTSYDWWSPNYGKATPGYETIRKRTVERDIWFSGAFTYHLPGGNDTPSEMDRKRLMAKLFGAEPDMNTVWQLTPWSWAVDWVSNASSFVKNLQSFHDYSTVMRYGYVMETTTVTDVYTAGQITAPVAATYAGWYKPVFWPSVSSVTLRTTTKKRIQANPFGFGLSWEGLSSFQQAILTAIGITRAVR